MSVIILTSVFIPKEYKKRRIQQLMDGIKITSNKTYNRCIQLASAGENSKVMNIILSTATPSVIGPLILHTMHALHPPRTKPGHLSYSEVMSDTFHSTIKSYLIIFQLV